MPLVVDVDGTLIRTDILHELALKYATSEPLRLYHLPLWLMRGKASLKAELAGRIDLAAEQLPLREETLAVIRSAQGEGREVYLASASPKDIVQALADRIGGIAAVFGSDATSNLAGSRKAQLLEAQFGKAGFDYVGDRPVDVPIWQSARKPLAVSHSTRFTSRLRRQFPDLDLVAQVQHRPRDYLRALRPHQWAKNLLVFLSLFAGHHFEPEALVATVLAFIAFCAVASGVYIINDLLDLESDRAHPRKHKRPFAAGDVPVAHGVLLGPLLMLAGVAISLAISPGFTAILLVYLASTFAYSLSLKRKVLIDIIVLAGLYTLRVIAGNEASQAAYSPWLLMLSLFLFLSLATVKRCSELVGAQNSGREPASGRGYRAEDYRVLMPLGLASGCAAVLVIALYLSSPQVLSLYAHPMRMWLICPLFLYWISRVFILANRDELHDDPLVFTITDKVSWMVGACILVIVAFSI